MVVCMLAANVHSFAVGGAIVVRRPLATSVEL